MTMKVDEFCALLCDLKFKLERCGMGNLALSSLADGILTLNATARGDDEILWNSIRLLSKSFEIYKVEKIAHQHDCNVVVAFSDGKLLTVCLNLNLIQTNSNLG